MAESQSIGGPELVWTRGLQVGFAMLWTWLKSLRLEPLAVWVPSIVCGSSTVKIDNGDDDAMRATPN